MTLLELVGWKSRGKWVKKEILIDVTVITLLIIVLGEMVK
jgi:hypothetical protein